MGHTESTESKSSEILCAESFSQKNDLFSKLNIAEVLS